MLKSIIEFSVRNKLIIALFTLGLTVLGIYETSRLPIDAVPDITDNQVQVITVAPSFGAADIERLVTFPIEQATGNLPGLKHMRSFSRFGLSLITLVFDDDVPIFTARQQVSERLQEVRDRIPSGIGTPSLGPVSTGLGEIYQYVLRPAPGFESNYGPEELRTVQDWIVRRQLLTVPGVAEVSSFGGRLKTWDVQADPAQLQSMDISLAELYDALATNHGNTGGSYIEKGPEVFFIRTEALLRDSADIALIPVTTRQGRPVLVRDVARVVKGHATRYGAMTYNDQGEVAGAVVMMLKGANSNEVVSAVRERVEEIKSTLPEGVIIEAFLDRSKMVGHAIDTVKTNLMEGALIVVFILVLFLGNIRAGLLVASVIPLSMLFAVILMNMFGVSGNLMSLGALDFGLIVDGAVIIVEAVLHGMHRLHLMPGAQGGKPDRETMNRHVGHTAGLMMNSAVFGQIIILIVYLPIFTLAGIEGKMFKPMAQTVAFALLGAFVLSLTWVPMMSALLLRKEHKPNFADRLSDRLSLFFRQRLLQVLRMPRRSIATVAVLALGAGLLAARLGGEFIPALEEGDFAVETRLLTGSNLQATTAATQQAAARLLKFPEVEKIVTKIGSGEVPTDPMPMEASDLMVILKDKKLWTSASTFPELADTMGKALAEIPGISTGFQFPVQMRFNELMTGARQDVVCKIFGDDLDTLAALAGKLALLAAAVPGAVDVYTEQATGMPQVAIRYKREAMARYGVRVETVNDAIRTAYAGKQAGTVYEGERGFSLVLRLGSAQRRDPEQIRLLPIPSGSGYIPLEQLADIEVSEGPNQIQREEGRRRIIVGFNVRGRDVQGVVEELRGKIAGKLPMPAGYYVRYGGTFENLQQASQRLMIAVPIALALIFVLLYFAFHSLAQGLLIFTAIPLSATGGIYLLYLRDLPFSISAGVGFIALFGVAVLNGIVLLAEFNRMRAAGIENTARIVVSGTGSRLRPVLMTAAVASLGFLPMALSNGAGAEVQRPLATVVIGGLLLATFLTLFLLPTLYLLFFRTKSDSVSLNKASIAAIILLCFGGTAVAQTPIGIDAATDSMRKHNLVLIEQRLASEQSTLALGKSYALSPFEFSAEAGQLNSVYRDYRLNFNQRLASPWMYKARKDLLAEWQQGNLRQMAALEASLRLELQQLFYEIRVQRARIALWDSTERLAERVLGLAKKRFDAGETDALEYHAAMQQAGVAELEKDALQQDLQRLENRFRYFLMNRTAYTPEAGEVRLEFKFGDTANWLQAHPAYLAAAAETERARALAAVERARTQPELSIGYARQSIRGIGADDRWYNGNIAFSSVQAGLSIPLPGGAQQSALRAAQTGIELAGNRQERSARELRLLEQEALQQLARSRKALQTYQESILPSAAKAAAAAEWQWRQGSIRFAEWSMLQQQWLRAAAAALDHTAAINQAILQLHYLYSSSNQ